MCLEPLLPVSGLQTGADVLSWELRLSVEVGEKRIAGRYNLSSLSLSIWSSTTYLIEIIFRVILLRGLDVGLPSRLQIDITGHPISNDFPSDDEAQCPCLSTAFSLCILVLYPFLI